MYKIEFHKDIQRDETNPDAGLTRVQESRIVDDSKMPVNLFNLQKRGWFVDKVTFLIYVHEIETEGKTTEDIHKMIRNIMFSYPEGFYFQNHLKDGKRTLEVYPPKDLMQYIPNENLA